MAVVAGGEVGKLDTGVLVAGLARLLSEKRAQYLPGAQLAPLVNQLLPQGSTFRSYLPSDRPQRLSSFVERYLPDSLVRATGLRQGSDLIYEITYSVDAAEVMTQQGKLWRSFVAVDPSTRLVYDPQTAAITWLDKSIETPKDCSELASVSLVEHRQMCQQFVRDLAATGVTVPGMDEVLEDFDELSYAKWLRLLRSVKPLDRKWGEYRHQEILSLYDKRLAELGVDEQRREQLKEELARDRGAARSKPVRAEAAPARAPQGVTDSRAHRERRAREVLRAAADTLSYEQILALQLPLGVMLDVLDASRS